MSAPDPDRGMCERITLGAESPHRRHYVSGSKIQDCVIEWGGAGVNGAIETDVYWGPSACTAIPGQIYDGDDMPGRRELLYAPSLYSPVPLAQLSAPTKLTLITDTSAVTLNWAPVPAIPDIGRRPPGSSAPDTGYRVHYDTDDACPPYEGKGLDQGDSPIDTSQDTSITLSGLFTGGYDFVVTTYDYLGRESTYSNVVMRPSELYLPLILRNG